MSKHPWLLKPIKGGLVINDGCAETAHIRVEPKTRTMTRFGTKGFKCRVKHLTNP